MTTKVLSIIAILLCCVLIAMLLILHFQEEPAPPTEPAALQTQPAAEKEPTQPPAAPSEPLPTQTEVPTEAPTEPEPIEYVLSFAGDCCLANLKGWSEDAYFIGLVGDNYDWPFASVQEYFATDDCTFVNLECVFTESNSSANKSFVFKGPPAYTQILTTGSVEFANVANNHTMDYGQTGYQDTLAALDSAGVYYAEARDTVVFTTESGLTLGVYADVYPEDIDGLESKIAAMRDAGAEVIIVSMHWGKEYYYQPNDIQLALGHAAIDAGADIVYGHHSHVLQPVEEYNGKMIYYSLGNFSFGGNTNPTDKDSAILQQTIIRDPDGTVRLGELTMIPCSLSSDPDRNNFQPTPLEPGTADYDRTMSKLDGSYDKQRIQVTYRPELG